MPKTPHILLLFCCFVYALHGQNHTYRQYTTDDGLPTNYVYGVVEDDRGYIWAYTENGIAKFDGHIFQNFTTADGLPNNDVYRMLKDSAGIIWIQTTARIGTYLEGDSIHQVDYRGKLPVELFKVGGEVRYGANEYYTFNKKQLLDSFVSVQALSSYNTFKYLSGYCNVYKKEEVYCISASRHTYYEYKNGNVQEFPLPTELALKRQFNNRLRFDFFTWDKPVYFYASRSDMILIKDKNVKRFFCKWENVINENPKHVSTDLNNETLIVSTDKAHLFFNKNLELSQTYIPENITNKYTLLRLFIDSQGNYWQGTREGGLFFINKEELKTDIIQPLNIKDQVIEKLFFFQGNIYAISDNMSIYQLKENRLNLMYQHPFQTNFHDYTMLKKGNIFFTNSRYPILFNIEKNKAIVVEKGVNELKTLHEIFTVYFRNIKTTKFNPLSRELLYSWALGTYCFNVEDQENIKISSKSFNHIFIDTLSRRTYFVENDSLFSLKNNSLQFKLAELGNISTLFARNERCLWIGTQNNGLFEWDRDKNQLKKISSRNYARTIWKEEDCFILATNEGVVLLEENNGEYQETYCYNKKDGLSITEILDVIADSQFIYAATMRGVIKIKKNHEPLKVDTSLHRLHITGININGKRIDGDSLQTLRHTQNDIDISYHLLDYASKGQIQYQYRLAPIQENWVSTEERNVNFADLRPQAYQFHLKAIDLYGNEYFLENSFDFVIAPAFWQTWWFQALVGSIALVLLFCIIKWRERIQQKKLAREKVLNEKIAELQLQSLRSQMNPHFIFNSLGSIQYFIQTHRMDEADNYLTTFARLMRKYLDSATERMIDLQKELDLLDEYTQLEMMRFESKFSTTIRVNEEVNVEEEVIPSMMLQPFVENAVNHGLQPRKGQNGQLKILFSKNRQGNLVCTISDNGIGRTNAAIHRKKSHKSRSITNVYNRIETLRANELSDISISIEDLHAADKVNPGTKVTIAFKKMTYD